VSTIQIAKTVLQTEANELLIASNHINEEFENAVNTIFSTIGKLVVIGVGKSGLVGTKIAATMASTGTPSFFLHPTEAMHGDLGMVQIIDTVLAISYSGESEELISILPHIKRRGIKIIGMSGFETSSLSQMSDMHISIKVEKEACPLNAAPTSSTTLAMAMGDALAVCLMELRGFKKEDFASFHPGGSLGKKLFLKISDLMRKTNLPIVSHETSLRDAIVTMSEGKLGNIIIEKENRLLGILSDGDLRRALMKNDFSLDDLCSKYATIGPKTINNQDALAVDVLRFIENNKIQFTVITNQNNEIIGAIHIHDLIEAGIK
jgi:arabinose-5-phosphate isomerase